MRVLMFGWEFPPFVSGGLGVACEGLVRGLLELDTEVALVLPRRSPPAGHRNLTILSSADGGEPSRPRPRGRRLRVRRIPSPLRPYVTELLYGGERREAERLGTPFPGHYGPDLPREVLRYAGAAARIALRERFDVIHAHDWLTFLAGLEARKATGRPLVLHVHATEFDRSGNEENGFVSAIERLGLAAADRVVAVSSYTAELVAREYGVPPERLRIVHNAIDAKESVGRWTVEESEPLVLFAGRITWQKGPGYFVEAAARVAAERADVKFVVAGSGDRMGAMREHVASVGLAERFLFTGFLPPAELDRLYARADVYVMPSVSEPFGLTALEALQQGTPVIISKSAGVTEVVKNVLRVEFGDVEDLASKILSVLAFAPLKDTLSSRGRAEVRRLSWREAASQCIAVYRELVTE
ncbi:MAG TPA: glycosyltransferase family 4 protein [Thermoanaerobaculia bacterium]|jgi:glycogen(starch) synthase|nr:glycosyltransferase family 4 protein [Thermoanaerobaculia bacterium]